MSQHILYGTADASALVIDLPKSISHAQRSSQSLRSIPGPSIPHPTPEPKGAKRDVMLSSMPADERDYHKNIERLLSSTLESIKSSWCVTEWCCPRVQPDQDWTPNDTVCLTHDNATSKSDHSPPLVLSSGSNHVCCPRVLNNTVTHNPLANATDLVVATCGRFVVPAECTFLYASIQDGAETLDQAVQCLLPGGSFDLVVLDPPWSNRSVRRSRAYETAEYQSTDPFEQTLPLLDKYVGASGYIAVWITNKTTVRSRVVSACLRLGFVLREEWVWLKVTTNGEPVTPLDGIWRKPYEILLIFHRDNQSAEVKRRVGIAVPDLHSRKPHLGSLLQQLLPENYNVLEVFARSLTAGWWSWGDEVLKFQHESHWV